MMQKIEKYLFYTFLFSIPFQTRKFLYSANAVEGFNEWQSIFLYGTDLIILLLFILWIRRRGIKSLPHAAVRLWRSKTYVPHLLAVLVGAAFASVFFAKHVDIGVYRFVKLVEFVFVFFYSARTFKVLSLSKALPFFIAGGVFQGFIAIGQFIAQRSLGLKFLGEPFLEAGMQNVAEFVAYGSRFMRAYGTFSSPNVLAAHLVLSLLFLLFWYISEPKLKKGHTIAAGISGVIISSALFLTFSRAAILAGIISFVVFGCLILFKAGSREHKKRFLTIATPLLVLVVLISVLFWPEIYSRVFTAFEYEDMAFRERAFFSELGRETVFEAPLGVGIGNYTLYLRDVYPGLRDTLYQPVHNIFILATAELGILGGIVWTLLPVWLMAFLIKKFRKNPHPEGAMIMAIIVFTMLSGIFDHYYWTLQQGALMFWLVLGISYYHILKDAKKSV